MIFINKWPNRTCDNCHKEIKLGQVVVLKEDSLLVCLWCALNKLIWLKYLVK